MKRHGTRSAIGTAAALVAAAAVAGCGGSHTAPTGSRAAAHPPHAAHRHPCPARILPAATEGRLVSDDASTLVCDYATRGGPPARRVRVRVTIDTLPQAYERWNRAQVETWQNYVGWHSVPSRAPQIVSGVGIAAFWIPHDRRLVTTAHARLVTVVVSSPRSRRAALPVAKRAARRAL